MRIGSLFSGIGGLELGLERAGLGRTVWQVERDAYCRSVLARHWPDVERFDDVAAVGSELPAVDTICGGFPCQDLSSANTSGRSGLGGAKSGLWSEYLRIVGDVRPLNVIVENVAKQWRQWVPTVRSDLWAIGYPSVCVCLRAADVGAPFEGARCFVLASANVHSKPARTVDAQMAIMREATDASWQDWGKPSPRALGVADGVANRMDRLRCAGNAVVTAMAEAVGRVVMSWTR